MIRFSAQAISSVYSTICVVQEVKAKKKRNFKWMSFVCELNIPWFHSWLRVSSSISLDDVQHLLFKWANRISCSLKIDLFLMKSPCLHCEITQQLLHQQQKTQKRVRWYRLFCKHKVYLKKSTLFDMAAAAANCRLCSIHWNSSGAEVEHGGWGG